MDNNFMRLHGLRMADAGYSLVPIAAGQKWPGEYQNGRWWHLKGWEFLARTPTPEALVENVWSNYPGCGVGIACGGHSRVVGVDIDILDAEIAGAIRRKVEEMLGVTPLVRVGKAPKVLLAFRCTERMSKLSYQPIEVLADGQQFVAYGIHPDTGLPYTWEGETPDETPVDSLPLVTPQQVEAAVKAAFELIPEELRARRLQSSDSGQHATSSETASATPEAIREALAHIPNPDVPWDEWKRVLMATFAASNGSEEVYFDFLAWSRRSEKHDDTTTRREWVSCRASPPRNLGFGTLHYLAKEHGWVPSPGLAFNARKEVSNVDIAGFGDWPMEQTASSVQSPKCHLVTEPPAMNAQVIGHAGEGQYIFSSLPSGTPIFEYFPTGLDQSSAARVEAATLPPKGKFYPASYFAGRAKTSDRWLVDGIIPRRKVTLLSGDGGTGKSLLALQLAAAVAVGGEWLGIAVKQGKALFLTAEDEDQDLCDRIQDIAAGAGDNLLTYDGLLVRSVAGADTALVEFPQSSKTMKRRPLLEEIECCLKQVKPALLVLDTLGNLFPGDENDRSQVVPFVGELYRLAMEHDTAILLLGHPSLSGLSTGRGSSGSTAWNNSVRSRLYLEMPSARKPKEGEEPAEQSPNKRALTVMKSNYGLTGESISMTWTDGYFVRDEEEVVHIGEQGTTVSMGEKAEQVFLALLNQYAVEGRTVSANTGPNFAPAQFEKHPEACGIKKSALRAAMNRLLAATKIRQVFTGPPSRQRASLVVVGGTEEVTP
jgi:RecA-family ATPase